MIFATTGFPIEERGDLAWGVSKRVSSITVSAQLKENTNVIIDSAAN